MWQTVPFPDTAPKRQTMLQQQRHLTLFFLFLFFLFISAFYFLIPFLYTLSMIKSLVNLTEGGQQQFSKEISLIYGHQKNRAECYEGVIHHIFFNMNTPILQRTFDVFVKHNSTVCEFCFSNLYPLNYVLFRDWAWVE